MQYLYRLIPLYQNKHKIVTIEANSFACALCYKRSHLVEECLQSKELLIFWEGAITIEITRIITVAMRAENTDCF